MSQAEPQDAQLTDEQPEVEQEREPLPKLSLPILSIAVGSQQENGLRYGDYHRYRQYCTRRLARIRRSVGAVNFSAKGRYKAASIKPDDIPTAKTLMIPLVNAERAWSYAMQLKQEEEENPRSRKHGHSRLRKAVAFAQQLKDWCDARADERTVLEADAYLSNMQANLDLMQANHTAALPSFLRAKTIYEQLSKVGRLEDQELYKHKLEELEVNIRFCNHHLDAQDKQELQELLSGANTPGMELLRSQLDNVMTAIRKDAAKNMDSIYFAGTQIPVKDDAVRVKVLSAQDAQFSLDEALSNASASASSSSSSSSTGSSSANDSGPPSAADDAQQIPDTDEVSERNQKGLDAAIALFDHVNMELSDTMSAVLSQLESEKRSSSKEANVANLHALEEYLQSLLLENSIKRNAFLSRVLLHKLNGRFDYGPGRTAEVVKPLALVRLYGGMEHDTEQLEELMADRLGTDEIKEMAARRLTYKALQSFWRTQQYSKTKQWAKCAKSGVLCMENVHDAQRQWEDCGKHDLEANALLDDAMSRSKGMRSYAHAMKVLQAAGLDDIADGRNKGKAKAAAASSDAADADQTSVSLLINQPHHPKAFVPPQDNWVQFPPSMEAVATKPLVFDLAGVYGVEVHDLSARTQQKSSGWGFGFW